MAFKFRLPIYRDDAKIATTTSVPTVKPASADYGAIYGRLPAAEGGTGIGWGDPSPGFIPSGGAIGTLYGYNWHFVARRAEKMAVMNGIFHRLHEIMRDNVCGQGLDLDIQIKEDSPFTDLLTPLLKNIKELSENNFFGKLNRIDLAINQWVFEQFLFGELPIAANLNEANGDVQWMYIPPRLIRDVKINQFTNQALAVQLDQGIYSEDDREMKWDNRDKWIDVVRVSFGDFLRDEKGEVIYEEGLPKKNPNAGKLAGELFYLRTGNVLSQIRGQGEGYPVMDMILQLENFQFDFQRAYNLQTSITYDMLIEDGTQEDCDAAAKVRLPSGRVPWVHNQKKKLTFLQPTLKIEDMTNAVRSYLVQIAGSLGVPEYMLGDGSQTNVATAREQAPALYQKFRTRQTLLENFLGQMLRFVIEKKNDLKMLHDESGKTVELSVKQMDDILFNVKFRPFERNNISDISLGFKNILDGAVAGITAGLITPELGQQLVHTQIAQLGIEVNADDESTKLKGNQQSLTGTGASGKPVDASMLKK